jgi:hypothetical protein
MMSKFLIIAYIFSFYITIRLYNNPNYGEENGFIIFEFSKKPTKKNNINGRKIFAFEIG